jgi:hypothetical protein
LNWNRKALRRTAFALLLALATGSGLAGQSSFMDKDQRGLGFDCAFDAGIIGTQSVFLRNARAGAGYSLDGFVDLGVGAGFVPATGDGFGSGEYALSISGNFTVLKQDRLMPFSLSLPGSVKKSLMKSAALDGEGLVESGTGYAIGIDLFRYGRASHRTYLRLGGFVRLDMSTYTTERLSGTGDGDYPRIRSDQEFSAGLIAGLSFRPNRANRGIAVSVDLRPRIDLEFNTSISAAFSFSLVETKMDKVQE